MSKAQCTICKEWWDSSPGALNYCGYAKGSIVSLDNCPMPKVIERIAQHDAVNHPVHYTLHPSGVECIQITEHMNFNIGNAVKYLWRADLKNGLEDLRKARWYIDREIQRVERCQP